MGKKFGGEMKGDPQKKGRRMRAVVLRRREGRKDMNTEKKVKDIRGGKKSGRRGLGQCPGVRRVRQTAGGGTTGERSQGGKLWHCTTLLQQQLQQQ